MPAKPDVPQTCEGCLFWRVTEKPWGKCVRHPPVLTAISAGPMLSIEHPTSLFPTCHRASWCGDWEKLK